MGNVEAALLDYSGTLDLDPQQWEAVASRGGIYYGYGDLEAALADFDRAIQLKGDEVDLYENRATVLRDLGRHEEEIRDLERAIQLNPGHEDREQIELRVSEAKRAGRTSMAHSDETRVAVLHT